jgi:hypothetical protein
VIDERASRGTATGQRGPGRAVVPDTRRADARPAGRPVASVSLTARRRRPLSRAAALVAATLLPPSFIPSTLIAQNDRITIRFAPRADQTIHIGATQVYDIQSVALTAAREPLTSHGETAFAYTETVGRPDEHGQYSAQLRYEDIRLRSTVNGQPVSTPVPLQPLIGVTITAMFDDRGRIQEVTVPPELAGRLPESLRLVLGAFTAGGLMQGAPASVTLGVGDFAAIPATIQLPIAGTAGTSGISGGRTLTLVAVEQDGQDRIARLQQVIEATMSAAMSGAASPSLKVSGSGTIEWNIDRGFAKTYDLEFTLDSDGPNGAIHGTEHVHMTGSS